MNRRNFLITGSAALAGMFMVKSPQRLYADHHLHGDHTLSLIHI